MSKPDLYYLLGAESPTAISFAQAYPELSFVFVSEELIISGQDLANVKCMHVSKVDHAHVFRQNNADFIPLTNLWYKRHCSHLGISSSVLDLSDTLTKIEEVLPGSTLPLRDYPDFSLAPKWILKGNREHKPNAIEYWQESNFMPNSDDSIKCQEWKSTAENYVITGRVDGKGHCDMGIFGVHLEAFGKNDQILAAETIENPEFARKAIQLLDSLMYSGYFSINIVQSSNSFFITSFRPYSKGLIHSLIKSGVDILDQKKTGQIAKSGIKMIVDICYTEYI